MPNAVVKLSAPLVGHAVVRQLEFREPRWDDIMTLGDPYVWTDHPSRPDYIVPTPIPEVCKAYAERLIAVGDKDGDPMLLSQLGVRDSHAVRDAIKDFFLSVDPKTLAGSTQSPTSSSSTANSESTPSAE